MNVQLLINDEPLDLPLSTLIPLVLQAQDLASVSDKLGSFSRSFEVPLTDNNMRLLETAFIFNSDTTFPYRKANAVLKVNGIEMPRGNVIIENDGASMASIRLTFYTGNSPFYQSVNAKKLRSVCFKEADHFWWSDFVLESRINFTNYYYPIGVYTDDVTAVSASVPAAIKMSKMIPALRLPYVISKIEQEIGYTFTGTVVNSELWENIIFPLSGDSFERDTNYAARNTWSAKRLTLQSADASTGMLLAHVVSGMPVPNSVGCYRYPMINVSAASTAFGHTFGSPDKIRQRITLTTKIINDLFTHSLDFIINVNDGANALSLTDGKIDLTTLNVTLVNTVTNLPIAITQTGNYGDRSIEFDTALIPASADELLLTATFEYETLPHRQGFFQLNGDWADITLKDTQIDAEFIADAGTSADDRKVEYEKLFTTVAFPISLPDYTKSFVSGSMCLPDVTIGNFLKTIANLTGCFFIIDEDTRQVEFFSIEDLFNNIPKHKDWSDKVVNIETSSWNTRADNFGQQTNFRYENEPSVGTDFGSYSMKVDDTTLPVESVAVNLPLSATQMVVRFDNVELPYIKRFDEDGEYKGSSSKQRILLYKNLTIPVRFTYDNGTYFTESSAGALHSGYFIDNTKAVQLGWSEHLFPTYYRYLNYISNKYKELTLQLVLNAADIQQLDFRTPVYLKQFASYFYVQKVSDWIPQLPAKVTLLKIG